MNLGLVTLSHYEGPKLEKLINSLDSAGLEIACWLISFDGPYSRYGAVSELTRIASVPIVLQHNPSRNLRDHFVQVNFAECAAEYSITHWLFAFEGDQFVSSTDSNKGILSLDSETILFGPWKLLSNPNSLKSIGPQSCQSVEVYMSNWARKTHHFSNMSGCIVPHSAVLDVQAIDSLSPKLARLEFMMAVSPGISKICQMPRPLIQLEIGEVQLGSSIAFSESMEGEVTFLSHALRNRTLIGTRKLELRILRRAYGVIVLSIRFIIGLVSWLKAKTWAIRRKRITFSIFGLVFTVSRSTSNNPKSDELTIDELGFVAGKRARLGKPMFKFAIAGARIDVSRRLHGHPVRDIIDLEVVLMELDIASIAPCQEGQSVVNTEVLKMMEIFEEPLKTLLPSLAVLQDKESRFHGDLHPKNIVMSGKDFWIVDLETAGKGFLPIIDILYLVFELFLQEKISSREFFRILGSLKEASPDISPNLALAAWILIRGRNEMIFYGGKNQGRITEISKTSAKYIQLFEGM